ncbi:MAG: exodeoxyribonuclease VII large subunit, partial [Slackia sp.]
MLRAKDSLEALTVVLIGEVSEVNAKAGYKAVYFTVKDAGASLPCMMWLNRYRQSGVELAVGRRVELTGRFTLYAPKGRMNFEVFSVSVAGEGDLRQKVAQLARDLEREGLMDAGRKRRVLRMYEHIGLVTSPRGDAVHDVMRTMRRRFPLTRISLAGVAVEGAHAATGMAEALASCAAAGCEAILLVRGGG